MNNYRKPEFLSLTVSLNGLITSGGVVASVCTLLGFLGFLWWLFDLFSHFRVQYLIFLVTILPVFLQNRQYKTAAVFAVPILLNLAVIAPLYTGKSSSVISSAEKMRILHINVDSGNNDYSKVAQVIKNYDPDFILLEEVNYKLLGSLIFLNETHPYSMSYDSIDYWGIFLCSKLELKNQKVLPLVKGSAPALFAEIETENGRFSILGVHPKSPIFSRTSTSRPLSAKMCASRAPPGPAPTTITSYIFRCRICLVLIFLPAVFWARLRQN